MADAALLVGTWRLVSYACATEDGDVDHPLGPNAVGYIMYTADGYMSVSMGTPGRPRYASEDLRGGTDAEKVAAADTYIAYCGKYELHHDRVVHHIELAFFPNRVGTSQVRYYEFDGNRITLTTPPMLVRGKTRTCRMVWDRVADDRALS